MRQEYIDDYFKRSGDSELPKGNEEENEHGFCIWRIESNSLILVAVYGDGEYWNEWSINKAMKENIKNIIFATKRKPDAFVRKYGYKVTGYILSREVK